MHSSDECLFCADSCFYNLILVFKGKRTKRGVMTDGLNSVMRYFINNFADDINQMAIDAILVGMCGLASLSCYRR